MGRNRRQSSSSSNRRHTRRPVSGRRAAARPGSAHKRRGLGLAEGRPFDAPEIWHEPRGDEQIRFTVQPAGKGYVHPVTAAEVADRIAQLPEEFQRGVETVQFSRITRKRKLFPCYGLQWGTAVYLYPIEESLEELYCRAPNPEQRIETEMFGGRWIQDGQFWWLIWDEQTIRDYYLNNVLIHEIGHINDDRNTRFVDRERYANWFAIEYGYRSSRNLR